jgi:hypothetical protein
VARWTGSLYCCVVISVLGCPTRPVLALDPRYPDWPCQQLKVPELSVASVWTGPSIDTIDTGKSVDPKEADLIARLAARRTPMEQARKLIKDYVTGTPEEKQRKATTLFAGLYSVLNAQRDQVMSGLERLSRNQKSMAGEIRENAQKIRQLQDKADQDPAESEKLASQLAWQTRIFEDRRQSTTYVCDVPVLIGKRLFDLARAIQDTLDTDTPSK